MTVVNLSEQLFKPQFDYPETSSLIQRVDYDYVDYRHALDGENDRHWYRVLNRLLWHWRGLSLIEIEAVLARIAVSDKKKSNPQWIDTVKGYQSGNWIYEFLAQANYWQQQASLLNQQSSEQAVKSRLHKYYLTASQYASLSSYPHYRDDKLAVQAQSLAYRYYQQALNYSPYDYKTLSFNIGQQRIEGILHLPYKGQHSACPVVLLCGGLSHLQFDFYPYFSQYLAPYGVGLLAVDTPGIGQSASIKLTQDSSILHQAVLEQLPNVPWIDHRQVILAGFRFGTQIATRLSYLAPDRVKGLLCFAPIIHQLYVDKKLQTYLPIMFKDLLADRLRLTSSSNQYLATELNYYSLKNQGLISKPCSVPMMSILFDKDLLCSESDTKLLNSTQQHQRLRVASTPLQQNLDKAFIQSSRWIASLIEK
jgi:esterase FrsA